MKNLSFSSLAEFKQFLENKNDKEKIRVYINNNFSSEIKNIAEFYKEHLIKYPNDNKYIFLNIIIHINKSRDYEAFLKFYCEKDKIKLDPIYEKVEFSFIITLEKGSDTSILAQYQNILFDKLGYYCKGMVAKIKKLDNLSDSKILKQTSLEFRSLIHRNVNIFETEEYKNKYVILNIDVSDKGFDLNKLHNNLLICFKYRNTCKGFILNIKGDISRIKPYVQNIISENTFVVCNDILIVADIESVGKLPPAIFFQKEDLSFFKKALSKEIWEIIKNDKPINAQFFKNKFEKRYWTYLRMCQKFLMEEFDDNSSTQYTKLRKVAYSGKEFFEEYVQKMPFLALCIFAIYDNFYRNNLLKQAKQYYNKKTLKITDLLLSEQRMQSWGDFFNYDKNKDKYDIKNLFAYDIQSGLHKTVISEIFECISIAEGMLQILENAVLHAGGGLLSMRVYSREVGIKTELHKKEHHVQYLNDTYSEAYFRNQKADFYLEIHISDLSKKSIPEKFVENLCKAENKGDFEKLVSNYKELETIDVDDKYIINIFKGAENNLEYFFGEIRDENLKLFRQLYYSIDENLVHHYGLEIFNNILTARNGIFNVCGYNLQIDNLEKVFNDIYQEEVQTIEILSEKIKAIAIEELARIKEEKMAEVRTKLSVNKAVSGTTYSILFPLIHSALSDGASNVTGALIRNGIKYNTYSVNEIRLENILRKVNCEMSNRKLVINAIAKNIIEEYQCGKVVCVNMASEIKNDSVPQLNCFEELIKGIILFALKTLKKQEILVLPIAIVNLTPFQLIEASRIISIYYAKETIKKLDIVNPFEKMPIYLKCSESGKDIVFSGRDIEEVKRNVIKSAMINGTMFDELSTIVEILRKESK